jgi:hypothetical protein
MLQSIIPGPRNDGPKRLDDALWYAVARVEDDPQNVGAILRELGWDGGHDLPINLAGEKDERASRALKRLREDGFVPHAVERSIAVIESSLPMLHTEVCEALMEAGLCFKRLSCEALLTAAQCFRAGAPFAIARLGPRAALVRPGAAEALNQLAARVLDLMLGRGCANVTELIDDARAIFGPNASSRFTEAALRSGGPFEWLDRDAKWFWYIGAGSNGLIHQIQRVMAVTSRIGLRRLRSAIRHGNGFGGFAPPLKVLEFICRHLPFVRLEGDTIACVAGMANLNPALTPDEKILTDVL